MSDSDTSLTVESATKMVDALLSAPPEKEKPVAPAAKPEKVEAAKAEEAAPEPTPDESEQEVEADAEPADENENADEPPPEPRKVKVKADGQDLEVTEDELIKSYSRHADYTTKTQRLADDRKAFEAARDTELATVHSKSQEFENRLSAVHAALTALTPPEPNWTDRALLVGEEQANAEFRAFTEQHDRLNKIATERDRVKAVNEAKLAEDADKHLETERGKLRAAVPEWAEPEKFKAGMDELRGYAINKLGFSDAELNTVADSRLLLVLRKAMMHDAQAAAKPKVEQKIADAMAPTKPGSGVDSKPMSELTKAKNKLAKSGRTDDAQAAIERLL